jgi:hypothetical protein
MLVLCASATEWLDPRGPCFQFVSGNAQRLVRVVMFSEGLRSCLSEISLQHDRWKSGEIDHHQRVETVSEGRIQTESQYPGSQLQVLTDEDGHSATLFELAYQDLHLVQRRRLGQ